MGTHINNPSLRRGSTGSCTPRNTGGTTVIIRGGGGSHDKTALRCLSGLLTLTLIVLVTQQSAPLREYRRQTSVLLPNQGVEDMSGMSDINNNRQLQSQSLLEASYSTRGAGIASSSTPKLPDWRLGMDCSIWDFHCVTVAQSSGKYEDYPFPYTRSYDHDKDYDWEYMTSVPEDWQRDLALVNTTLLFPPPRPIVYHYKNQVTEKKLQKCLENAQTLSWQEQLNHLISTKRIQPSNNELNLLAFTISDFNYAKDMLHDVFEMNDNLVGFQDAFFLVAIDHKTLEMACRYDYPVIAWPTAVLSQQQQPDSNSQQNNDTAIYNPDTTTTVQKEELKHSVANTKLQVSLALLEMDQSLFFYEMDVWFLKSPLPVLELFTDDILFGAHQNCPMCVNIGVYLVHANAATREYFETAIRLAEESPNTHDQWILSQIIHMQSSGSKFEYGDRWDPKPVSGVPKFHHFVKVGNFGPHEIVASERPYSSQLAMAIHPLRESPLKDPHGKKMLVKEMGAWYGFRGPTGDAGYYHRTGENRRYLIMDGHLLNGYSTVMNWEFQSNEAGLYHDTNNMRWTIAALVALARRTGRILVLPGIAKDRGLHFAWTWLDLASVEELGVDYRETTYFNNPKSWTRPETPFGSVARTALGNFRDDATMFCQYSSTGYGGRTTSSTTRAWKLDENEDDKEVVEDTTTTKNKKKKNKKTSSSTTTSMDQVDAIDAWWALHTAIPEVDAAEALLVNTHFLNQHYHRPLSGRLRKEFRRMNPDPTTGRGRAEFDIASVFAKLRWCQEGTHHGVQDEIAGVFKANDDCYGKGAALSRR